MHAIWWDYSNDFLNIHGRTCLYYAVLWGILSVLLINYINPLINRFYYAMVRFMKEKRAKTFISVLTLFLILDSAITCMALENFLISVSNKYDINIKGINKTEENEILSKYYPNERMMMVYPNIIVVSENGDIIYLESVLDNIKNYYYKFGVK